MTHSYKHVQAFGHSYSTERGEQELKVYLKLCFIIECIMFLSASVFPLAKH